MKINELPPDEIYLRFEPGHGPIHFPADNWGSLCGKSFSQEQSYGQLTKYIEVCGKCWKLWAAGARMKIWKIIQRLSTVKYEPKRFDSPKDYQDYVRLLAGEAFELSTYLGDNKGMEVPT